MWPGQALRLRSTSRKLFHSWGCHFCSMFGCGSQFIYCNAHVHVHARSSDIGVMCNRPRSAPQRHRQVNTTHNKHPSRASVNIDFPESPLRIGRDSVLCIPILGALQLDFSTMTRIWISSGRLLPKFPCSSHAHRPPMTQYRLGTSTHDSTKHCRQPRSTEGGSRQHP